METQKESTYVIRLSETEVQQLHKVLENFPLSELCTCEDEDAVRTARQLIITIYQLG